LTFCAKKGIIREEERLYQADEKEELFWIRDVFSFSLVPF
jgi:hypothetical protein